MYNGYFGDSPVAMDNNVVPVRNLYPGASGATLATIASAGSPDGMYASVNQDGSTSAAAVTPALADTTAGGHPLTWWVAIAVLVAGIFFTARKTGNAEEFSNLRASTYNIAMVTLIAILGITVAKIFAVKVKGVPGLGGLASVIIAA